MDEQKAYDDMKPGDEAPPGEAAAGTGLCPECSGSGRVDGRECETCAGTGQVEQGVGGG